LSEAFKLTLSHAREQGDGPQVIELLIMCHGRSVPARSRGARKIAS
jgi:hypothetical protein